MECKGLQELVEAGKAIVVVLVKSSAASYSKIFRFTNGSNEIEIRVPKFSVVNKIDLTGLVIAAQDIQSFVCKGNLMNCILDQQLLKYEKAIY